MHPLETILRAASKAMGGDPELWRGLEGIAGVVLEAAYESLPPDLADALRRHLGEAG